MDYPSYLALYYYLANKRYPIGATETIKRRLRDQATRYQAAGGKIYRRTEYKKVLGSELLHEGNIDEIIKMVHNEGHFGVKNTWHKLRLQYTGTALYERTKEIVKTCYTCQFRKRIPRKRFTEGQPIPVPASPFYMVGCDAVGPTEPTVRGNRYLLVAIDYLTRWPVAKA
ncbi:hypothetical protein INT45_005659, partial [Circinella minor]